MKPLKFDALPITQQRALIDMASRRGLLLWTQGYAADISSRHHARRVVAALERLGLCVRRSHVGAAGSVVPTEAGWSLAKRALKDTSAPLGSFPASLR